MNGLSNPANALRENLQQKTIPSLNGLRGIAALTVAFAHASGLPRWIPADYAVVLFFEISGLLITWLLLTEQEETGSIDQRSFMKRRTLRLFPAFYLLWTVCWLVPHVPGRWWAFAYMMDVYSALYAVPGTAVDVLGMAWSLGIEEKYYLIWPALLKRVKRAHLLKGLLATFVAVQIYHVVVYRLGHEMWAAWSFDTRIDAILLGSALAVAIKSGWRPPRFLFGRILLWGCLAAVMVLSGVSWVHRMSYGVLLAVYPLAIVLMSVIAAPPRVLNNRVASYFGKISYSLYLFNPLVAYLVFKLHIGSGVGQTTLVMAVAILVAVVSYHMVEVPFLRLKNRAHKDHLSRTVVSA